MEIEIQLKVGEFSSVTRVPVERLSDPAFVAQLLDDLIRPLLDGRLR